MRMIQLHNGEYSNGQHGFSMEMNAFGDMVSGDMMRTLELLSPLLHFLSTKLSHLFYFFFSPFPEDQ